MDQIALSQATSAAMRDVLYVCQQTNARWIVLADEVRPGMSAFGGKADIAISERHVCF
jgi:hypothetical protein